MTNPQIGLFLALVGALALGLNGYRYWTTGSVDAMMLAPTVGLVALLAVLPFLSGWRPNTPAAGHVVCASCASMWNPADDKTIFCPGCGKMPKDAPAALVKHPYASPLRR